MAEEVFLRFGRKNHIPLKNNLYHIRSNIYHRYVRDLRLYVFTVKVIMCKHCKQLQCRSNRIYKRSTLELLEGLLFPELIL
jgi:hypothetical protein